MEAVFWQWIYSCLLQQMNLKLLTHSSVGSLYLLGVGQGARGPCVEKHTEFQQRTHSLDALLFLRRGPGHVFSSLDHTEFLKGEKWEAGVKATRMGVKPTTRPLQIRLGHRSSRPQSQERRPSGRGGLACYHLHLRSHAGLPASFGPAPFTLTQTGPRLEGPAGSLFSSSPVSEALRSKASCLQWGFFQMTTTGFMERSTSCPKVLLAWILTTCWPSVQCLTWRSSPPVLK